MKLKKVGIALCLSASLLILGACNSSKGSTSNQKAVKTETVAFQKDINQKNERVWLITSSKNFGKDSKIVEAIHVENGKTELITPGKTLRELDKVSDDKVWNFLVKANQESYREERQQKIDDQKKYLAHDQGPTGLDDYTSKEELEKGIKQDQEILDVLNKTTEFKPVTVQSEVSIVTDSTGNQVNKESLIIEGSTEVYALLDTGGLEYNLESPVNTPIEILNHSYLGFDMKQATNKGYEDYAESYMMLTRKTDSIKNISFDKASEKGVKELQDND
ncbi:hypothetical protein [Lactococcus lactis]|uniref:hypothetical protein n=1 Tax=Lactococcus lactis TaxID=1358 RepID=UPI0019117E94|nr:hypothetical protein [Lactococcus lactis]WDA67429.1 hypothetical protein IL310_01290 [Lactococcus lactis]WDA67500.1 hypothetical protein IL310_01085 [Lactococcus lactis]